MAHRTLSLCYWFSFQAVFDRSELVGTSCPLQNYLQRIPQTHTPTTQSKPSTSWGWPASCRIPTPAAIPQTSLQGEEDSYLSLDELSEAKHKRNKTKKKTAGQSTDCSPPHVFTCSFFHQMYANRNTQI